MSSDFERFVERAMREPTDAGTPCPSAETLAAYLEHALGRDEHASVERHASLCSRCATHLAALVQLEDQLAAAAPLPLPWWRRRPWLVPAAAAVVAGVVWTSLPRERVAELTRPAVTEAPRTAQDGGQRPPAQTPPPFQAGNPATAPAEPPLSTALPPGAVATGQRPSKQNTSKQDKQDAPTGHGPQDAMADLDARAKSERAPQAAGSAPGALPGATAAQARASAERRTLEESTTVAPAPPLPAAPARPAVPSESAAAPAPAPPPAAAPALAATSALAAAPPAASTATAAAGADSAREQKKAAGNAIGSPAAFARESARPSTEAETGAAAPLRKDALRQEPVAALAPTVVFSATGPHVAWRVASGRIERTTDGGATWVAERAPAIGAPIVGSAPSADVCWLAGAGGTLLRRDTGGAWTRRSLPAGIQVSSIAARSVSEATLVAAGGRRFATTDGGTTWIEVR
jgi:hypothetical protein